MNFYRPMIWTAKPFPNTRERRVSFHLSWLLQHIIIFFFLKNGEALLILSVGKKGVFISIPLTLNEVDRSERNLSKCEESKYAEALNLLLRR